MNYITLRYLFVETKTSNSIEVNNPRVFENFYSS